MIRHVFVGPTFHDCSDADLSGVVTTLRKLTGIVPWIRNLSVEKTLDTSGTRAIVLIAEFDTVADFDRYMSEPGHLALGNDIKDFIDLDRMTVVQTKAQTI